MYKCIIVDDEKPARDEMMYFLDKEPLFTVLDVFSSSKALLDKIDEYKDQKVVFFLDVDMPNINGIKLCKELKGINDKFEVIFTTAYEEYALKAFDLDAYDYLLKPIEDSRMDICIKRIKENKDLYTEDMQVKSQYISLEKNGKIYPIKNKEILFIKALNRGVYVVTTKGDFEVNINLCEIKEKLDSSFFKCHRSYLINLSNIDSIEPWFNRTYQIKLKGSIEEIPISRNYVNEFKKIMSIM